MKKIYLLILLFFSMQFLTAQTTETFESSTIASSSFTSGTKTFNLTSSYVSYVVSQGIGLGYNQSNRYIQVADSAGPEGLGQTGTITAATGSFKLSSLWIYLTGNSAQDASVTSNGLPGSVTFRGKLAGVTQFTVVKTTTGADTGYVLPGNGFLQINFATEGGSNNTNIIIDQLEVQLSSNYDYFAIDNFTWNNGASAPTVTTVAATNVKSVSATLGGNVTADGGDASIERGIVWATTANPTTANTKVQIGTGLGTFSNVVTGLPPATTIHFRGYAINSGGTSYGADQTFTTGAALSTSSTPQTNVSCNGGSNGTATVVAVGGTSPYTYSWSPSGGTGATASGLSAGPYTVTITDNESTQITRNFTIAQPPVLNGTPSTTTVSCFGGSNGTATIAATGGTPSYTYLWSNGATTASATGLLAGTYSVTITDANSCTRTVNNITIGQPAAILNGTPSTTAVSCFGGSNGTATITASGGTPGYTYLWSNGATTASATGLIAGTYSVTITDAHSCTRTVNNITVGGPAAILNGTPSTTAVSCFGGSNGTATITASGGTSGYTYLWSNGATTASATGLIAGTYSVTITDANSCTRTVNNIIVGGPASIINGTPSTTAVSCFGGSNGTATITASGGTPGYTYLWSNGATTASATGLIAGTYSVTITDANSCTRTVNNITVGQSSVINATPTQTNVSCNGGSNGSATVTPTGGAGAYTYLWSNGATTSTISGITQGNYSVTITDANSCQTTQNFTITQPAVLTASQGTINNVSCNGGSNGTATVLVTGGTGAYTYSWSPSGGTSATATGLTAGTYTVTVNDANLCQTTQSFTITEPNAFSVTTSKTDVLCNGSATGSATVNVTGGAGSYTYSWAPSGGTSATATGLIAGTYTVTITDANTCQTTRTFTINQPNALIATPASQTNIGCRGEATGSATVNVTGGTGTYTYSWAPSGGTAATASGLVAGTYIVTVKDANLCQTTQSFTITQPAAILSATTASTGVSCFGGTNGSASVTVSGGTPGYTYLWAPLGGTSVSISGRPAGNYTCTITDSNGCTLVKNITISTPAAFSGTISKTDVSCNGGSNGTATVTAIGATTPYNYAWSPSGGTAATATGLSAGNYTVTIQDANTCVYTVNVTINQPAALSVTPSQTNVLCNGGASGTANVSVSGGTPGYTYIWSPSGGTTATAIGLSAGNYSCLITDSKGCTFTQNFNITQPAVLAASTSKIDATCIIGGQASVTPIGGTSPYTYLWAPSGATTATVTGLPAGNHSVLITDGNGCTLIKNFTINTTNTLTATTSQTDVLCNGSNTGSATVVPSGAPAPFTYVWAPLGGNAATANNLAAGNYTVTITSANGCSTTKSFTITQPSALVVTPSQTNLSCNGGSNGSASVNVTGGTGAYTYAWSPSGGTSATATGLVAGNYTVTITDANLCQTTQSFVITEPTVLASTTIHTNVSCNGGSNGSATVSATGGTGAYTYVWSPSGGTAATASGLTAGTYTVTISDANLCQTTETVTITEPLALDATISQNNVTCLGETNGSATVSVIGGTGAYTYLWSPSGGTSATATGLAAGNYTVTITDANSCTLTKPVTILTNPDILAPVPDVTNLPDITNYCSILSSEISIPTATDICVGSITATTTNPLNYTVEGNYTITWSYSDGNGNTSSQNQTIHVLASPLNQVTFSDAEFTFDGNLHTVQVANLPAGASVTYTTNPATGIVNGATNAGVYTVTATVSPSVSTPNCSPITLTAQLTIKKATQQITFGPLAARILGINNNFNLNANSNSGLAIRYSFTYTSALPPANVSATGLVNLLRSGQITITAHQDGNANYLPAADVSQVLVIKNNDVTISQINIGNQVFQNPPKDLTYLMSCGESNVNVVIANTTNATITPSANFTITPPKPGIYTQNVTITSEDGSSTANYTIKVEKPFGFFDIVRQKFNNVLLVNNNPLTNGGYEFVSYQWFKNGVLVGTGQYYTAGNESGNVLDTSAVYSVKMTTKDGKVLQTCGATIALQNSFQAKLYPNPIETGKIITVEADYPAEELENMQITLYSVSGQLIKTVKSSTVITEIQLPPTTEGNIYLVVLETANVKKSFKVIVK
ncbi:putative secreted protein (Por secretion system target) [Flavobacterium chryseum]|uniref:T9SS type A sorting domain-containing protein n=1 Tax=Flavobacterium sp. P3160 TaxID=2512113 RepID=UPI00105DFE13|nr:T9SS type A sorting domain-containing protein [Flavobacterium sp. P3160]TDO73284.1 putative secreted protein (Por secretion system target) [Flavobacterium sp. P3160]